MADMTCEHAQAALDLGVAQLQAAIDQGAALGLTGQAGVQFIMNVMAVQQALLWETGTERRTTNSIVELRIDLDELVCEWRKILRPGIRERTI